MIVSTLSQFRISIDRFNASQPNKDMLDDIRNFNHRMIDTLDAIVPMRGRLVLDIGASPHGYALEHSLEKDAGLYVGIGLDFAEPQWVLGDWGNVGVLLAMDASKLHFPDEVFDFVLSLSTFEHLSDVDSVLREINRVLKPDGRALITFEPIWTCSYGHHLHHLGKCAKLVPPWAHLTLTPERLQDILTGRWPKDAPVSLEKAIQWTYMDRDINRLGVREYRRCFGQTLLRLEWMVELREEAVNPADAKLPAAMTGLSVDELTIKGFSVLLSKRRA